MIFEARIAGFENTYSYLRLFTNMKAALLPTLALYLSPRVCATLCLIFSSLVAWQSFALLLGSARAGRLLKTLSQRIAAVAALLGLTYAACDLFWRYYEGFPHNRWPATGFYVFWHILGGMLIMTLVSILIPRSVKAVLVSSFLLLTVFNLFIVVGYATGRVAAAIVFSPLEIGVLLGAFMHSLALLRIENFRKP